MRHPVNAKYDDKSVQVNKFLSGNGGFAYSTN